MDRRPSIAELKQSGFVFRVEEAVAVAQQLIEATREAVTADQAARAAFGPPSLESVFIDSDGRVTCPACESALAVSEPYATHIRAGRCIPHPRHWLKLVDLAGVSARQIESCEAEPRVTK